MPVCESDGDRTPVGEEEMEGTEDRDGDGDGWGDVVGVVAFTEW